MAPGVLHMVPSFVPVGFEVSAMTASVLPWGGFAYAGLVGTRISDGRPALALSYEWPMTWLGTLVPAEKIAVEWLHIRRFSTDHALATGVHAFARIAPGADPPDVTAITDAGVVGVEATALAVRDRRRAHAMFGNLRRRLAAEEPAAFTNLRGHLIYVWFEQAGSGRPRTPYRTSDDHAIDELLRALASYEPQPEQSMVEGDDLPTQVPPLPLTQTTDGAKFYSVPLTGAAPTSVLFTIAGFEIGLAHSTLLGVDEAWRELQRLVDKHDSPGVDVLLISAAAPDSRGVIFPTEEALRIFLLAHPQALRTPKHIKEVVLHSWLTGEATALFPDPRPLFGPLYSGMALTHQPFALAEVPPE